jgi:hypothetical protein
MPGEKVAAFRNREAARPGHLFRQRLHILRECHQII